MPNTEEFLYQTEKQPPVVFYKNAVLKTFAIFMAKHLCEIFKNTYFEEHLRTAASELTLHSDCLELSFWIAFTTLLNNITKIPVAFKPEL